MKLAIQLLTFLIISIHLSQSSESKHQPKNISAEEGDVLILNCIAKDHYESCTFKHNVYKCEFKYLNSNDQSPKTHCSSNLGKNDRIKFVGNYENHTCAIELKYVRLLHEGQWSCSTKLLHKKTTSSELKWFLQVNQNSKSYLTISLATTISIVIIGFGAIFGCYFFGICDKWNLKFRLTQCCRGAFGNCKLSDFLKRNTSESDEPAYYVTKDFSFQNEPMPNSSRHEEIKYIRNTNSI